VLILLDSGFRDSIELAEVRNDKKWDFSTFYETIKLASLRSFDKNDQNGIVKGF